MLWHRISGESRRIDDKLFNGDVAACVSIESITKRIGLDLFPEIGTGKVFPADYLKCPYLETIASV
jgi:hypothetical protein